ncbi:MAG: tyrosine-type recombinase/integrase [Thermomicrobia bacterium]|nr:tyrosine-type recombinase/integrase [Thermomicrobia bacterium]MCA1724446.1 tyrosine-type recombinase/integrase [Thermomicrobia bacterium]
MVESATIGKPLVSLIRDFLADLRNADRSDHTIRAYEGDLLRYCAFCGDSSSPTSVETLRAFFASRADCAPATRARTQAALASFFAWAYRGGQIPADPMAKVERVRLAPPPPRGVGREVVTKVLAAIPVTQSRDRLLFRLIAATGLRVSEALGLYVEDLDLTPDDEHLRVKGKGGRHRTLLLDDPALVRQVRTYLRKAGYQHGPLFRAAKNGTGGPLAYQSIQERWAGYCRKAGVACTLHQLRHTHATELVNDGVSLATIRKRLGHKNLQTTLRYAEQSDQAADAELRAWRRGKRS